MNINHIEGLVEIVLSSFSLYSLLGSSMQQTLLPTPSHVQPMAPSALPPHSLSTMAMPHPGLPMINTQQPPPGMVPSFVHQSGPPLLYNQQLPACNVTFSQTPSWVSKVYCILNVFSQESNLII